MESDRRTTGRVSMGSSAGSNRRRSSSRMRDPTSAGSGTSKGSRATRTGARSIPTRCLTPESAAIESSVRSSTGIRRAACGVPARPMSRSARGGSGTRTKTRRFALRRTSSSCTSRAWGGTPGSSSTSPPPRRASSTPPMWLGSPTSPSGCEPRSRPTSRWGHGDPRTAIERRRGGCSSTWRVPPRSTWRASRRRSSRGSAWRATRFRRASAPHGRRSRAGPRSAIRSSTAFLP